MRYGEAQDWDGQRGHIGDCVADSINRVCVWRKKERRHGAHSENLGQPHKRSAFSGLHSEQKCSISLPLATLSNLNWRTKKCQHPACQTCPPLMIWEENNRIECFALNRQKLLMPSGKFRTMCTSQHCKRKSRIGLVSCPTRWDLVGGGDPL